MSTITEWGSTKQFMKYSGAAQSSTGRRTESLFQGHRVSRSSQVNVTDIQHGRHSRSLTRGSLLYAHYLATPHLNSTEVASPMKVIEVSTEQRRNERARETGDPRESPPTSGIARLDTRIRERPRREPNLVHLDDTTAAGCGALFLDPGAALGERRALGVLAEHLAVVANTHQTRPWLRQQISIAVLAPVRVAHLCNDNTQGCQIETADLIPVQRRHCSYLSLLNPRSVQRATDDRSSAFGLEICGNRYGVSTLPMPYVDAPSQRHLLFEDTLGWRRDSNSDLWVKCNVVTRYSTEVDMHTVKKIESSSFLCVMLTSASMCGGMVCTAWYDVALPSLSAMLTFLRSVTPVTHMSSGMTTVVGSDVMNVVSAGLSTSASSLRRAPVVAVVAATLVSLAASSGVAVVVGRVVPDSVAEDDVSTTVVVVVGGSVVVSEVAPAVVLTSVVVPSSSSVLFSAPRDSETGADLATGPEPLW
ncbi:hypothetical protein PR048_026319 [Dryococelus australis]|uniref:Uncharacterized protein n=1 Tax=Dryococelus australis TaxID=614101 RepID=A0ABQ9GL04_9NEOP|nr:hypothetical protein PR048_026319 [Dryococelus australis]